MELHLHCTSLLLTLVLTIFSDGSMLENYWKKKELFADIVFLEDVLLKRSTVSLVECALLCQIEASCNALSFEKDSLVCTGYDAQNLTITSLSNPVLNTVYFEAYQESVGECGSDFPQAIGVTEPERSCSEPGCVLTYTCAEGYTEVGTTVHSVCGSDGTYSTPSIDCQDCFLGITFKGIVGRHFSPPFGVSGHPGYEPTTASSLLTQTQCLGSCLGEFSFSCKVAYFTSINGIQHCTIWPIRVEDNPSEFLPYLEYDGNYTEYVRKCV